MTVEASIVSTERPVYLIGVDAGTGSIRAGLFNLDGRMLAAAKHHIPLFREEGGIVEQSSTEIWSSTCAVIREIVANAGVNPAAVIGLDFDATCSLVVEETSGNPLVTSPSEDPNRNISV